VTGAKRRRVRISIRYKFLLMAAAMMVAAASIFIWLGTTVIIEDRLVYTFDLNSALVDTLSAEVGSRLQLLAERSQDFAVSALEAEADPRAQAELVSAFIARHSNVVRIAIYRPQEGRWRPWLERISAGALDELGLSADSYTELRPARPLPFEGLARLGVVVHNTSIPPDAVILSLAAPVDPDAPRAGAVVVDFKPVHLLRILAQPGPYTTYLVDREGHVLVHPSVEAVVEARDLKQRPLVQSALESPAAKLVREFEVSGAGWLGAFAKIEGTGTAVLAEVPRDEALRAARELVRRTIFAAVGIVLAAFIIIVIFTRLITRSLRQLSAATEAVGQGRFDVSIDVHSSDEIGELADRFRAMIAALQRTQAQLVQSEKMAAFGQLGAGITHEVKNPLTGILGFAQLGQRASDPTQLKEMMAKIEKGARSCKEIVDRFLTFARADSEKLEVVDLNQLVKDGVELSTYELCKRKINVALQLGEGLPPVKVNRGAIQQVLLNLAINAQDVMPDGGELRVATARADEGVRLTVSDTGPGIPAEIRDRIFEPFFTTKPAGQGTGLGLAIVYGIVDGYGGRISVVDMPGQGATISIWLPAAPVVGVSSAALQAIEARREARSDK